MTVPNLIDSFIYSTDLVDMVRRFVFERVLERFYENVLDQPRAS
mgnify:CR=1 FL=1